MMFLTHIVVGLCVGLLFIANTKPDLMILALFLILLGTVLPDIDAPNSKAKKRLGILGIFVKHRGIFHSLLIPIIVGLILFDQIGLLYGFAFFLGYVVHLILDSMTKTGIAFLYPFTKKKIKGKIRTGAFLDKTILFVFCIIDILLIFRL